MSIHEENTSVENTDKDDKPDEVSWYIGGDERDGEKRVKNESKIVHPEDRQIDRVGSLGFLYQKTSLDKADVNANCSESSGGQQMLTPVINGVAGEDGNKQPKLSRNTSSGSRTVQSTESLDLDNFLLSESSSNGAATGTSKYSDLHHHALSLEDLEDQNDQNESDIPLSETSTSLVPSVKSNYSGGLVRDDSLEGGSSILSKDSSDRLSPSSFRSDHSRPVSPLSMSDTESLAPMLSPLPPTPEMMYDFEELEDDLCDNQDTEFKVEPHDSLETPPLPEYANRNVSTEESLNTRTPCNEEFEEAFFKPIKEDVKITKNSPEQSPLRNILSRPIKVEPNENSCETRTDDANEERKNVLVDSELKKVEPKVRTKSNGDTKTEQPVLNNTNPLVDNVKIPGAFIKLGSSAKKTNARSKPAVLTRPYELTKEKGAKNREHRSSGIKPETVNKASEKFKSSLQKSRSKGAKIDDINIVPCRQHSHNPISSRSRKPSNNVIIDPADHSNGPLKGAEQTGANSFDHSHGGNSAENFTSKTSVSVTETLGPLKQKKRVSRVKSLDRATPLKTSVDQAQGTSKIWEVKPIKTEMGQPHDVEFTDLPKGKTSDQFKRRTSRFPSSRKVRSLGSTDDSSQLQTNLQHHKDDAQVTTPQAATKRKRAQSSGGVPSAEPKPKKVWLIK